MSVAIANYSKLELQMQSQEATAAAQLHVLAGEAAAQIETANQQREVSEANAAVALAKARDLEQQLVAIKEQLVQQQQQQQQQQHQVQQQQQQQPAAEQASQSLFNGNCQQEPDAQAIGVGSRWSLVMKEHIRQQQRQTHNCLQEAGLLEFLERTPPPSPLLQEQLSHAAATNSPHNQHNQLMQHECEMLQAQLRSMQTRAETSETRLQQMIASTSNSLSPVSAAAANSLPQRNSLSSSAVAADVDATATDSSNLLQLSQLTAQVVLDCRRMTEVNHEHMRQMQVSRDH